VRLALATGQSPSAVSKKTNLGQQQVFPAFLRKMNLLFLPAILPLMLLIFWLFRVRFTNAYKGKAMPRGGDAYSLRT